MDDPKIKDAETETIHKIYLHCCVYNNLDCIYFIFTLYVCLV